MTSFDEAYRVIMSFAQALGIAKVPLKDAPGRVLATDVVSDADMPPFNRSAMDGYACRRLDLEGGKTQLKIIEEVPAGKKPTSQVKENTCVRIMTGAEVPEGADWVVRVEDTAMKGQDHVDILEMGSADNIRYAGEDLKMGEVVIRRGTILGSQHVGLLAMVGEVNPEVYRQPAVGIMTTGSELVDAGSKPGPVEIRNSSGPQLMAQLLSAGINGIDYGIVKDNKDSLKKSVSRGIEENDVLILTGGVSMGAYDYVPEVLKELGFDIKLHKIRVRPGKPLLFAVKGRKAVFGLPGNPVSTFVQFEVVIRPFLMKVMGAQVVRNVVLMEMGEDMELKPVPLRYFIPVAIRDGKVFPVEYHGSGHLAAYTEANGILEVQEGTSLVKKNDKIYVRSL